MWVKKFTFLGNISYLYTSSSFWRSFSIQSNLFYYSRERFFALKPDNFAGYFCRRQISEMGHIHMFAITIS